MEPSNSGSAARQFEFLDHTADIQIHSWGTTLREAFENAAVAMTDYISDLSKVEEGDDCVHITADGHDLPSLLYAFMDDVLFQFNGEYFLCKNVQITLFDVENFKIEAIGKGENFVKEKHPAGTEIKAITYSNMQIHEKEDRSDVYVIVDI